MANTSLKFGNGNWAIKEDSALAYSDQYDNFKALPFDFSRAGSGTIVNKEGLIESISSGLPRIDFSDSADGALLLEPQSTNLATYSEDFDNASWNKFNSAGSSTPIISSNYGISPDGTQNADRIQVSRGSDALDYSSVYKSITISSSSRYLSVWLKSLSGTPTIIIGQKNGVYVSQQITTEWVRYELDLGVGTFTELFVSVGGAYYASGVNESADFLAWGYQLEAASYATSYIPTQGSAVTRLADDIDTDFGTILPLNGEVSVYIEMLGQPSDGLNPSGKVVSVNFDNTTEGSSYVALNFSGTNWRARVQGVGASNFNTFEVDQTETIKALFVLRPTTYAIYANGNRIGVETRSYSGTAPNINEISNVIYLMLTENFGITRNKDLRVYNTALSNAEAIALTTL